jgi:hypothetical protein
LRERIGWLETENARLMRMPARLRPVVDAARELDEAVGKDTVLPRRCMMLMLAMRAALAALDAFCNGTGKAGE